MRVIILHSLLEARTVPISRLESVINEGSSSNWKKYQEWKFITMDCCIKVLLGIRDYHILWFANLLVNVRKFSVVETKGKHTILTLCPSPLLSAKALESTNTSFPQSTIVMRYVQECCY